MSSPDLRLMYCNLYTYIDLDLSNRQTHQKWDPVFVQYGENIYFKPKSRPNGKIFVYMNVQFYNFHP